MIDLYTWGTPNGRKVSIMLEELEVEYSAHSVNIGKKEQYTDDFIRINPNSKIPAIVDHDVETDAPITLFESGAILIYLAEKYQRFLPKNGESRYSTLQWLMFQMAGPGPIFGQVHHFLRAAPEPVPYAIDRYRNETDRLYGVLDKHLSTNDYLASEYSIADIATYPWIARHEWHQVNLDNHPNVKRWYQMVGKRPAVEAGMTVPFLN